VIRAAINAIFVLALFEAALAPRMFAGPATKGPAVPLFSCSVSSDPSPADFSVPAGAVPLGVAMADFTGDSHPDLATLKIDRLDSSRAYYVIEIQLTEGGRQSLKLTAPPRSLILTPMDVTGDGTLDLVVRSVGSTAPIAVFLNDGCGHFSANEPARFASAIQEIPGGPDYSATNLRFESVALARGADAAGFQFQVCRLGNALGHYLFLASCETRTDWFVPLRSDRAPPAFS
jgi:hypothetical protein